jgi:hypothetical protein
MSISFVHVVLKSFSRNNWEVFLICPKIGLGVCLCIQFLLSDNGLASIESALTSGPVIAQGFDAKTVNELFRGSKPIIFCGFSLSKAPRHHLFGSIQIIAVQLVP